MFINNDDTSNLNAFVNANQRYILAIDGLSRSGKTTFVKHLSNGLEKEEVEYTIFHIDDHIVNRSERYNTGFEEWYEYFYLQWNVEWLRKNLFKKLRDSSTYVKLPFYDNENDRHLMKKVELPKAGLIVIEGVFLQRKEWKNFYNEIIYLNCSREKRFGRELEATRLNREKFEKRYWKAEEYYINTFNPLNNADTVIKT
ncbi:kinase [Bacillus sp. CHD6a]|uniref:kinase n=1 Tax=Bacillus sp. CHD6a TaxID=1643452 RepID=UPI0006CDC496|nr:kinase [Bacillus sp. CHD6a]KPB06291.1 uridine kinase [Bacillus sp. CHD6a]